MGKFQPKIIENGQFYLFNDIVDGILNLKSAQIITAQNMDAFISNKNLKRLFEIFCKNELISRLISLISFIKEKDNESVALFIKSTFKQNDIISLLQLSSNSNKRLAQDIISMICDINNTDKLIIDWHEVLKYTIKHNMLHDLDQHGYDGVVSLDLSECKSIIQTYCSDDVYGARLSHNCWELIIKWISSSFHRYKFDEKGKQLIPKWINNLLHYFCSNECFECLLSENSGDAIKWINLAMYLMEFQNGAINENIYSMNGVI